MAIEYIVFYLRRKDRSLTNIKIDDLVPSILLILQLHVRNGNLTDLGSTSKDDTALSNLDSHFLALKTFNLQRALLCPIQKSSGECRF